MTFDAVVFDVDGVLVDTDRSYTEAVIRTVQHFLVREAGVRDDGPAVDRATVRAFYRGGSWNNDWDLAYGLLAWLLAAPGVSTRARARHAEPAERAARRTRDELARAAGPALRWSWEEVRGVFEELYNGSAVAAERYGVAPRLHLAHGLAAEETVLLERRGLEDLAALGITKIGVVTGRTAADFAQVRARLPFGEGLAIATDDDGHKPDPALLAQVMTALDAHAALAVGDTLDDLRMAQRYAGTALGRERPVTPVILCGPDEVDAYRAAGARHFIRRVGELPALARTVGA